MYHATRLPWRTSLILPGMPHGILPRPRFERRIVPDYAVPPSNSRQSRYSPMSGGKLAGEQRVFAAWRLIRNDAVAHRSQFARRCLHGRSERRVELLDRLVEGDLGGLHRQDAADTQYRSGENAR